MSEGVGKENLSSLKHAFVPATPEITCLTSPGSTARGKSLSERETTTKVKKKYSLSNHDSTTTAKELASLLIYVVFKPQANLEQEVSIDMLSSITTWLDLHNLMSQAKFWITSSCWTHLNVIICPLENVPKIVRAIDACYIDILIEAAFILDNPIFLQEISADVHRLYGYVWFY